MDGRRSDEEIMELLRGNSSLNAARAKFSHWSARIEQRQAQRQALSPIEMRRLEFEAVEEIVATADPIRRTRIEP